MIFEQDNLQFQLLDVLEFDDANVISRTRARPFCALSLRIDGDTEIDFGSRTLHVTSRDLAFFPANLAYLRRSSHDKMIVFHFNVQNCVGYELEILHDFEYETLLPMFAEARREWILKEPGYRYRASAILYGIFAVVHARLCKNSRSFCLPIADAVAYITENYRDQSLSVAGLAGRAHMSDTYFRRLFKRDLGVSPKRYIDDLRLEHAQSLLNAGYDTVAAVAEKVGFGDAKNFATAYKKNYGYPPSAQTYEP